ncbi:YeeE/YedE family protein [Halioxenophilus aromaticivorans]|uniref:YeeE/YedE family protein n=1 Tax=Halioxenophilus aromaticivorans TaxID=1306992 RepID=A0AAV3U5R2_9ALTE
MWVAFVSGLLFGLGLAVSNMLNPQRVLAFLDIFGTWDPTLAFVMGGALLVTVPGFALVLKRSKPLLSASFSLPSKTEIDRPLIIGAVLFGLGWGLAGLCPGPALAALVSLNGSIIVFVAIMLISWWLTDRYLSRPSATK